jgi:hypothetical protein
MLGVDRFAPHSCEVKVHSEMWDRVHLDSTSGPACVGVWPQLALWLLCWLCALVACLSCLSWHTHHMLLQWFESDASTFVLLDVTAQLGKTFLYTCVH